MDSARNVLITGTSGFIGGHFLRSLEAEGLKPRASDKRESRPIQQLLPYHLDGVTRIFHFAATARVGISLEHPEHVIENNVESTLKLLQHCRMTGSKMIFISSSSVRFADLSKNPYALSKKFGEDLCNLYRNTYGVDVTILRLFNVYGPGEADYGKHTTLIRRCQHGYLSGAGFDINGDGSIVRDYTHVDDVVRFIHGVWRQQDKGMANAMYDVGSGEPSVTVKQIVEEFQRGTDLPIRYHPPRFGDPQMTCADKSMNGGFRSTHDVLGYIREWKASLQA